MKNIFILSLMVLTLGAASAMAADQIEVPNVYQDVYNNSNQASLQKFLKDMTGVNPVTVNGKTFSITERYSPASKANFRAYWSAFFKSLGMDVTEMPYTTRHNNGETQGHNVEAVLPGKSADSIIIIVHYDSMGPFGNEIGNPGVDDDMSGMAVMLETARLLSQYKGKLTNTVRFVAADYEEWSGPGLEGARTYGTYIKALAAQKNFKLVAAIDDEQIGWNCAADGMCGDATTGDTFDVFSCDGGQFDFPQVGDALAATAAQFSTMKVNRGCMGANSDHYAMWEIGVPAVVFSEHQPFNNPHFDGEGGDTYDKIDQTYFFNIARVGVTFAAQLVGITP